MAVQPELVNLTLAAFADRLADRATSPAGGCAAAALAACGAGLVSMAFRASTGEDFASVAPYMEGRAEELDGLRARALELVDEDAGVWAAASASDAGEEQRAHALEVPFEIAEVALAALRLAAVGAPETGEVVRPDALVGALALWSALEGAAVLVDVNASRLADEEEADQRRAELEAVRAEGSALLAEVQSSMEPTAS